MEILMSCFWEMFLPIIIGVSVIIIGAAGTVALSVWMLEKYNKWYLGALPAVILLFVIIILVCYGECHGWFD